MRIAVCAIAKDEEAALPEWIAYYTTLGFDEIAIYDNSSSHATKILLDDIARMNTRVRRVSWPDRPGEAPQQLAYEHACHSIHAEWIAFFDIDEFLVLRNTENIHNYMAGVPEGAGAIAVNWRLFGSSGRIHPGNGLVIERFLRCAPRDHTKNLFCKSIVRPASVENIGIHTAVLKSGYYVGGNFQKIEFRSDAKTKTVDHSQAQLNHYLLKSWDEFVLKRARGNAARAPDAIDKFSHRGSLQTPPTILGRQFPDYHYWHDHDLNCCWDKRAARSAPDIRREIKRMGLEAPEPVISYSFDAIYRQLRIFASMIN